MFRDGTALPGRRPVRGNTYKYLEVPPDPPTSQWLGLLLSAFTPAWTAMMLSLLRFVGLLLVEAAVAQSEGGLLACGDTFYSPDKVYKVPITSQWSD